ncbi:hypothetical protein MRB53_016577 [Persea americana]|uniref:Uncharacterized protein n=1 Tax=Persea americana TaxID=3435 RepID=A0ACC2M339_PERAE|nr:hypothetical protein MRB53_016577 [Persea americana]
MPKTILQRVNELRTVLQEKDDQAKQHRGPTGPSFGYTGGIQTRTMKLDFPHFDGTNPSGWLFKAKQYFAYHQVPVEQWLTIASLNMNADALEWYQWYMEYKPKASWEDFVAAMDSRFGPPRSEDYAGKLSKLRQTSTVIQYQQEFQRLSNRVRGLSEAYLISLYLSGLRDEIRIGVHKMNPSSLPDAFSLARLQEEEANLRRRVWRPEAYAIHFLAVEMLPQSTMVDPDIHQLVNDYADLFSEPRGLPPQRQQDHAIPLIEGTSPINVRPYRLEERCKKLGP